MIAEGGIRGLWRGNGMNIIKIAPESAFKFAAYDVIKRYIRGGADRELFMYERLMAGSLAGGISQSIIYPLEVPLRVNELLECDFKYHIEFCTGAENENGVEKDWRG